MPLPQGRTAQFSANGRAVYTLDGHATMEFSWYDVDPNLPDAATCIVRIYNRAMRRWECMYSTNRFNAILYFGGVEEGDRIVLHPFETDTAAGRISYWTFHDMQANRFGWFADTSLDRGKTFTRTWIIQATRKD